jgi:hypothetical protein
LLWCVQAFLALVFVSASWAKLMGKPEMVALTAHLFILHVPPTTPGVLFLMSGFVAWGRRQYGDASSVSR